MLKPILVAAVAACTHVPAADPGPSPPPAARTVLQNHFDAIGGQERLQEIRSMRLAGTLEDGPTRLRFEFLFEKPGQLLLTATLDGQPVIRMGRDDQARCWRQDTESVRNLDGTEAGELMNLALALHPPALFSVRHLLETSPSHWETIDGKNAVALGRGGSDAVVARLVFDASSGLLMRVGTVSVDDYRPEPTIVVAHQLRTPSGAVFRVEHVEINPVLEASLFARPSLSRPGSDRPNASALPVLTNRLSAPGTLAIVRQPPPADFERGKLSELPHWDPRSSRHAQVDLRGFDLRALDLRPELTNLLHADFDSRTRWPRELPAGFDRAQVVELGRNPGLGIRRLHRRGITGRGVGIGIIDQPLLVTHVEYADRLRCYEEIHSPAEAPAQMHGPAVTSIAAGRTTGVAPEADLYYIAEQHGDYVSGRRFDWDFTPLAQSVLRLLQINDTLPAGRKIRVISVSVGWSPQQKGYDAAMAAVAKADTSGVFVVSTALEATHQLTFHGLGREALADPDVPASFGPGSWWAGMFWDGRNRFEPGRRLLVPMDCRAVASPTGPEDYVHYWSGGWSWSVPWIAGLYALACQVKPDITPREFWTKALETGSTIPLAHESETIPFGTIADPVGLIDRLQQPIPRAGS